MKMERSTWVTAGRQVFYICVASDSFHNSVKDISLNSRNRMSQHGNFYPHFVEIKFKVSEVTTYEN